MRHAATYTYSAKDALEGHIRAGGAWGRAGSADECVSRCGPGGKTSGPLNCLALATRARRALSPWCGACGRRHSARERISAPDRTRDTRRARYGTHPIRLARHAAARAAAEAALRADAAARAAAARAALERRFSWAFAPVQAVRHVTSVPARSEGHAVLTARGWSWRTLRAGRE